jgi:hypothetical protein
MSTGKKDEKKDVRKDVKSVKSSRPKISSHVKTKKSDETETRRKGHVAAEISVESVDIKIYKILDIVYPDLLTEHKTFISKISWIDYDSTSFESIIEELVKSINSDPQLTYDIVNSIRPDESIENINNILFRLPSMSQLEFNHAINAEGEFHRIKGSLSVIPCKVCGGFEFYLDPDRQTSAGDEASKSMKSCVVCKPRHY